MKTVTKHQMRFIEGADGNEFAENYNQTMSELTERGIQVDEKMISLDKLCAVVMFTEKVKIAESLKDRYELSGIHPICEDCPHYESITKFKGVCPYVRGDLYHDDAICGKRWAEIEEAIRSAERRVRVNGEVPKLRGRTCQGRRSEEGRSESDRPNTADAVVQAI